MYNIRFDKYIPVPNPATSKCIVAAHYYAAWKKGAAELHEGFNDLAEIYPDRTPLMGYYDEENPEVCDWEIKWAVEHGVNCFIHCWYRRKNNVGHPLTEKDIRCGHGLHEALFNAKYQNMINFTIMWEAQNRWGGTTPDDMVDNLMPFWIETYFKRQNYLKIDNKPVLFVYDTQHQVENDFANAQEQKETFDRCREYAKTQGFDGLIIALMDTNPDPAHAADAAARGYDFRFGYCNGWGPEKSYPSEEEIIEGQVKQLTDNLAVDPERFIPTVTCFRDSTPRYTERWQNLGFHFERGTIWYLQPDGFRRCIRRMNEEIAKLPENAWGRKIFMLDNWNEWDEGHFISPSMQFGFRYLQAVREELTERDNLPDYRTPQEIGFTGYNTSWVTPDFTEFCKKTYLDKE